MKNFLIAFSTLLILGCSKKETAILSSPIISTTEVTVTDSSSAITGGNIKSDGGSSITSRGVVWDINPNPTINLKTKTNDGSGIGIFSSKIFLLNSSTTYYVRAYATNSIATSYGEEFVFKTKAGLPKINTSIISQITFESAVSGGTILSDGGSPILAKGIVWGKTSSPSIPQNKNTNDGSSIDAFTSKLDTLSPNTTYYVRAYASNSIGTAYGNEIIFKTNQVKIGDKYQGGIVVYILKPDDQGYDANVTHGIISSTVDQSTGIQWYNGTNVSTNATGTKIGTGFSNTNSIIASQGPITTNYAAGLARAYLGGGYSDWYLPSLDELNILYQNKSIIGGFTGNGYWSSSEAGNLAYLQNFTAGGQYADWKYFTFYVRAIRSF